MPEDNTLSFHGVCHFIARLSKAAKRGVRASLAGCPKCHFPALESVIGCINSHGQDGVICVSDMARELHQPLPAISRGLRQLEQGGLIERSADPADRRKTLVRVTPYGYAVSRQCEAAISDYLSCVVARLQPEQRKQLDDLRLALMDAVLAENAARSINQKGEPDHDKNL